MKRITLLCALLICKLAIGFAQPGILDSVFGDNGMVINDFGPGTFRSRGWQVLAQPDGSIYILFEAKIKFSQLPAKTYITKRDINGAAVKSYGKNGFSDPVDVRNAHAVFQPGGKLVVVGTANQNGQHFALFRYNIDGSIDTTFGNRGLQTTDFGGNYEIPTSIAVQGNGKIVVAGYTDLNNKADFAIARFNVNGSIDKTFSKDGKEKTDFGNSDDFANSVAIGTDGKIGVAGYTQFRKGNNVYTVAAIARYNNDGSLDSTFSNDGKQPSAATDSNKNIVDFSVISVAIQNDHKIIVAGSYKDDFALARYNIDGSLDSTFSEDGKQIHHINRLKIYAAILAIQADGKILAAGYTNTSNKGDFIVVRFNSDGSPDKGFSQGGTQTADFSGEDDDAYSIALLPDGKILVGGNTGPSPSCETDDCLNKFAVVRFNTDGTFDNTLNGNGKLTGGLLIGNTAYSGAAMQNDGKVIVIGSNNVNFISRYNSDGTPDKTFGKDGNALAEAGANAVAVQNDGKILVLAYSFLARYNTDGSMDSSFGTNGKRPTENSSLITIQKDGKIIVVETTYYKDNPDEDPKTLFAVTRYNSNGTIDSTFDKDGRQTTFFIQVWNIPTAVAIQADGKIVVTGLTANDQSSENHPIFAIARYNVDGSLDSSFNATGKQTTGFGGRATPTCIAIQDNNKIVVGGVNEIEGEGSFVLVRYNDNGTFDDSLFSSSFPGIYYAIAIQSDNKIILGGTLLTRLTANGNFDSTFNGNGIQRIDISNASSKINSISIFKNKLYASGNITFNQNLHFQGSYGILARYFLQASETKPAVTIISPADYATYLTGEDIHIKAIASDPDGKISKVAFYKDSTLLHTITDSPYVFKWASVLKGNYTLTAVATDNSGLVTTSSAVHISVVDVKKTPSLYGITYYGGVAGTGTINKFTPATNTLLVAKSLEKAASRPTYSSFVKATDGKLYGMTSEGGSKNLGVIFSWDPSSSTYTKCKDFEGENGADPHGSLVLASDGKLYGMTAGGGSRGFGVIFSFNPLSSTYTKLLDFDNSNGGNPYGNLMQAANGKLYGMTYGGGAYGVIFSYDPASSTYTKIKGFNGVDGSYPLGSLIQANNGKLYGITPRGGISGRGVIFSLDPSSKEFIKLADFDHASGGPSLTGSLAQASDGKLYGMSSTGGDSGAGLIFSFDPSAATYTIREHFDGTNGSYPYGSLVKAGNGKLYGMTTGGGSRGSGVIFSFDPSSSTCIAVNNFDQTNGSHPQGSLFQYDDGKLYGMTTYGGSSDNGLIFSFDLSSSAYIKLKSFGFTNQNGSNIPSALVNARDGKLYGITNKGGSRDVGIIFSFERSSSVYTKLKDFDNTNGGSPKGSLIQASNGKLYGMTNEGGKKGVGVIFSYDPTASVYTKLMDFDITNGSNPNGRLLEASDGKLYGMASTGGNKGFGVIFSFDPSTLTYKKLVDFDRSNGGSPEGSLIQASDGRLLGMTVYGGRGGVIFAYDLVTSTYSILKDFDYSNGYSNGVFPRGSLFEASDGKLYGTAGGGHIYGYGIIFSFDPSSSAYLKLKEFDGSEGRAPSELMQASDGKIYGMTGAGGSSDKGVIFSYDPSFFKYTKLKDFDGANGAQATTGSAFIEVIDSTSNIAPLVKITDPARDTNFIVPGPIVLNADAHDPDGTIQSVDFYNDGSTLLFTDSTAPYSIRWFPVPTGSYHITTVATDNNGAKTTSASIHITVLHNRPPKVNITSPVDGTTYTAPANIILSADAIAHGGKIKTVKFYNGETLIHTEENLPYIWTWKKVPEGNYTITARAKDTYGRTTISAPVTINVTSTGISIAASSASSVENKIHIDGEVDMQFAPNPSRDILNIRTKGLRQNKRSAISIISTSGVILKTVQLNSSGQALSINISSLAGGVYFIKLTSGDKVMYKEFVKM